MSLGSRHTRPYALRVESVLRHERLFAKLEEIREVILANAGQVAALRATIDALIFTHSDLPRFSVALTALMERTDAVLNGQAQDGILEAFRKQRIAVETFVAEGIEQSRG